MPKRRGRLPRKLLLEDREDMPAVAHRRGHSDVRLTLNTYSHVTKKVQQEMAEKIDRMFD